MAIANFRGEKRGTVEERYQLLGTIGRGAFGEVKKIKDRTTGETRALKVCPKSHGQVAKEDIGDEIAILQQLVRTRSELAGPPERRALLRVLSRRDAALPRDRVCPGSYSDIARVVTCSLNWHRNTP